MLAAWITSGFVTSACKMGESSAPAQGAASRPAGPNGPAASEVVRRIVIVFLGRVTANRYPPQRFVVLACLVAAFSYLAARQAGP